MTSFLRSWGAPLILICIIEIGESYPETADFCLTVFLAVLAAALLPVFEREAPKEER
jgi:hypothetical protein